jgi:hypothetical protein
LNAAVTSTEGSGMENPRSAELPAEVTALIAALEQLDPILWGERVLTIRYEAGTRVRVEHQAKKTYIPTKKGD